MIEVAISGHAREQGRARGVDERTIRREVADGLQAGRRAKAKPRWASLGVRHKAGGGLGTKGMLRYVWNPEETRAYVVRQRNGGSLWIVITVLIRRAEAAA